VNFQVGLKIEAGKLIQVSHMRKVQLEKAARLLTKSQRGSLLSANDEEMT
jgi:hypothetical protein